MAHAYIKDGRKTLGLGSSIVTVMQPAESNRRKARHQRSRSEFCTPVFPFLVQDACDPRDSSTRTRKGDVSGGARLEQSHGRATRGGSSPPSALRKLRLRISWG